VVPITFGAIARFAGGAAPWLGIEPVTTVHSYCGQNFDLSILEVWTTPLHGGCGVLVAPEDATRPDRLLELVLARDVHVVQGVPMLLSLLLDAAAARGAALPGVRHVILTGDATPMALLARLPGPFSGARVHNVYGCTETNDSFVHEIDVARELQRGAIPLGEPLPGVRAQIVESGRAIEGSGVGELWVSTPFQAPGYLGAPAAGDGFGADGFYRSRDLVRRDASGTLFLEGRTDSQVKVRGVRVNLQAVEQALLGDGGVAEAAVFAVEEAPAGRRLIAVLRRREGIQLDTLSLRARCARELGRIAVPATIEVQDAALPRTPTGKVDRNAARTNWQSGGS
jgi:acyl-coenzyme A synthetase/AMP-(fatty) acid ligase